MKYFVCYKQTKTFNFLLTVHSNTANSFILFLSLVCDSVVSSLGLRPKKCFMVCIYKSNKFEKTSQRERHKKNAVETKIYNY